MTDFIALLALLAFLAITLSALAGGFVAYLRQEWHLMRADTWATSDYIVNPALGTVADPRVAWIDQKRRALGKRLRREGRGLLGPKNRVKAYVPELAPPAEEIRPPKADKVVPIRRRA